MKFLAALALSLAFSLAASAQTSDAHHSRHALLIGIGHYAVPTIAPLAGVVHDIDSARQMAHAMGIPDENITLLRDRDATAARIRDEIHALDQRVADGDRVFVYYSGHGTRWYDPGLRQDACTEGLMAADGRALTNVEIGEALAPLARKADKMIVFYDACFSGGVAGSSAQSRAVHPGIGTLTPKFTLAGTPELCAQPSNLRSRSLGLVLQQAPAAAQNVVHIAAAQPDQVSFDSSARGGLATSAWRDCLLGEARDLEGSGAITVEAVTACAQAKVSAALAPYPDIAGQQLTLAGNKRFVPAWMGAAFDAAAPAAPRQASAADILAQVNDQRDANRGVTATPSAQRLKIGHDQLQIDVSSQRDGHLYIALAGSDGQTLYLLFPNNLARDNRIHAGEKLRLPGKGWDIVSGGPAGTETLLVMVTDSARDLGRLDYEEAGPFMKTLLDARGRARLQEVLSNGTPGRECDQAAGPCSDAFGAALLHIESVD